MIAATRSATKAAPEETKLAEAPFVVTVEGVVVGTGEVVAAMVPFVPEPPLELPEPEPLDPEPEEPEPDEPDPDEPVPDEPEPDDPDPLEPEPEPLEPLPEDELPLSVGLEAAPVVVALTDSVATSDAVADPPSETTAVAVPETEALSLEVELDEELEEELQERSYKGVVVKVLPTIPKLGDGVSGAASWRVYHQTFVSSKRGHPTSSQYVLALSVEGTAWFSVGPLTGQPVSVIQTGLDPTAALV